MLTILECVQAACNELGLTAPVTVYGAADLQTIQLGALMNADLREIRLMHDWTSFQTLFVINVGPALQTTGTYSDGGTSIVIPHADILTLDSTNANIYAISGADLNQACRITAIDTGTDTLTIDMPTTGAATATDVVIVQDTYQEPADFDHFINETWWDRTNHWQLLGPDSPQRDEWHRSGIVTTGPRRHFRQVGRSPNEPMNQQFNYRLWPPIGTVENNFSIAFEYISKYGVQASDLSYKERYTDDDDLPCLEDNIAIMGAKWRMFQIKQLDYAPLQAEYLDYVNRRIAQDGGAKTLSLSRMPESILISPAQVQDGFFPGV